MAQEILREVATSGKTELEQALFDNEPIASFLEQTFNFFAEEDFRGHSIKLTAPSWWGLARIMKILNDSMCETERK